MGRSSCRGWAVITNSLQQFPVFSLPGPGRIALPRPLVAERGSVTAAGRKLSGSDGSLLDRTKSLKGFPAHPQPPKSDPEFPQAIKGGHRVK